MERFKHFALTMLIALTSITASAYDFEADGIYYNVISQKDMTCVVTNGDNKYSGDIVIPSTVIYSEKTYSVTSIGRSAFYGCSGLTSVVIGNFVTKIGEYAFWECSGLKSVTIPNSVTSIGADAFYYCSSLTSVEIPNSVTLIGYSAFYGCSSLISVVIPNSITTIKEKTFYGCSSLTSMEIPNSITSIEKEAFYNCSRLTSVEIPNSVTLIGYSAFYGCSGLTSVVIENSVTTIGESAFYGCSSLTSVTIHNSVTSIGYKAFYNCTSLTSVVIGNSVTKIGESAFASCSSLTSVEIPNSVNEIGEAAFSGCSSLTSITGKFVSEDYCSLIVNDVLNCVINNGLTKYAIPNSVTRIGDGAFKGCSSLTSVTIPNSVTSIGKEAFYNCFRLTSVEIPNSVTSIGMYAFWECHSLTSMTIPSSVNSIGPSAFNGCYSFCYVTFGCPPAVAKIIPRNNLKEITLQENLTHFLAYPFNDCERLNKVTSLAKEPLTLTKAQFTDSQFEKLEVIVPDDALEKYMVADVWKEFKNLKGETISDVDVNTCEKPVLSVVDGQLKIELPTEGSKCKYSISTTDTKSGEIIGDTFIPLSGQYTVTVYAFADGYKNSETVTATLVWVNPTFEGSSVMSMEAKKAVLVSTQGGNIIVSGTERGEGILLYTIDGRQLRSVSAEDGETVIPCTAGKGEVVIVKYGDKAVKVMM